MAAVRRNVKLVARIEQAGLGLVREAQAGGSGEQQHPFAFGLVVPEAGRARLAPRYDPLDAQAGAGQQGVDGFALVRVRQWEEQLHAGGASRSSAARSQCADLAAAS